MKKKKKKQENRPLRAKARRLEASCGRVWSFASSSFSNFYFSRCVCVVGVIELFERFIRLCHSPVQLLVIHEDAQSGRGLDNLCRHVGLNTATLHHVPPKRNRTCARPSCDQP